MISSGVQNPYNLNLKHLEEKYSNVQAPYEDSSCEEMLLYKGTSRRATGINKSISAMKQYLDIPVDELRVGIYACTGSDVLECVYSNVEKGFPQSTMSSNSFLGQNTNQNLLGAPTTMSSQGSILGGLTNNQMLSSGTNTMFSGIGTNALGASGGTFQNTNTMNSNVLGGGTTNMNLLQPSGSNLLGGSLTTAASTQLGGGNIFQSGVNTLGGQQTNTLFQPLNSQNQASGGLLNTTNTSLLGQANQLKTPLSINAAGGGTLGLQSNISNPLGGLTGIGSTTTTTGGLFDKGNTSGLMLSKPATQLSGGGLLSQPTTSILGGDINKSGGIFARVSAQPTQMLGGGTTTSNTLFQPNSNTLGGGLLQNTNTTGGLLNKTSGIGGQTLLSGGNTLGGGVGLGNISNTSGLGLGLGNVSNTTGLGLGNIGNTNTSLLQSSTNTLGSGLMGATTVNNTLGLGNAAISTNKPGQRTITVSLHNTKGLDSMVVNEEELLELRRQRQINRYMDSMRNHSRTLATSDKQLSDTSLIQATSQTSDKILNSSSKSLTKYTSPLSGLPTNFNQISRMYSNKGLSSIQHYARQMMRHNQHGGNINTSQNATTSMMFDSIAPIEVNDEASKFVKSALMASKRDSLFNESDTLPLLNIKTELDDSIRYPRRSKKRGNQGTLLSVDMESTRCSRTNSTSDPDDTIIVPTNDYSHKSSNLNDSRSFKCAHSKKKNKLSNTLDYSNATTNKELTSHQARVKDGYSTSSTSLNDNEQEGNSFGILTKSNAVVLDANESSNDELEEYVPTNCHVILKRSDYYTKPTLKELDEMCVDGKCLVKGFLIGRKNYGFVTFPDEIDVYGLNLDEIVFFNQALVEVYPDSYPNKPPQGKYLNRRAIITLYNVFPGDSTNVGKESQVQSSNANVKLMEDLTLSLGALFLDYNPIDGTWTFEVPHFTKYGLNVSSHSSPLTCNNNNTSFSQICGSFLPSNFVAHDDPIVNIDENLMVDTSKTTTKRRASRINEICESSSDIIDITDQPPVTFSNYHSSVGVISPTKPDNTTNIHDVMHFATFPKSLMPDIINQYTYLPSIFASTKPYESSSIPIDNSRGLLEYFIQEQSKDSKSIGNCLSVNHTKLLWDVSLLMRQSSHIGCQNYVTAYVQSRLITQSVTRYVSLTPQVIHVTNMKQFEPCDENYLDPKTLAYMLTLVERFSSQGEPTNMSGIAQRKITSASSALEFIDKFIDYYTSHSTTVKSYYIGPLFMLLKILFVNDNSSNFGSVESVSTEQQRKNKLFVWIKMMTDPTVTSTVYRISMHDGCNPYKAVKMANYYIASQRCNLATDTLANNNFDQLALLSTIVHADDVSKYRISCQIDKWHQMNTLGDVGDDVLTLLSIISGSNSYPITCGSSLNQSEQHNVDGNEYTNYPYWINFDWISAFGLYLFNFHTKSNPTIKEVFQIFTTDIGNVSEQYSHCRLFNELGDDSLARFFSKLSRSLLYVYCGNSQPFTDLVDEFVVVNEHYSPTIPIIWFVVVLLNELLPNGVFSKTLHVTVSTRFAELLEHIGQWDKAILVLNFIDSIPAYCRQVEDILMRNYLNDLSPQKHVEFLRQHNLVPHDRDIMRMCSVAHIKSYPYENLKLLQEIISENQNILENDLERGQSSSIEKHISTIEVVLYRLNQFNAQSHSELHIIDELRCSCVDMINAINNKVDFMCVIHSV